MLKMNISVLEIKERSHKLPHYSGLSASNIWERLKLETTNEKALNGGSKNFRTIFFH